MRRFAIILITLLFGLAPLACDGKGDEKKGDEKNGDEKNGDEKNGDEKKGDEKKAGGGW